MVIGKSTLVNGSSKGRRERRWWQYWWWWRRRRWTVRWSRQKTRRRSIEGHVRIGNHRRSRRRARLITKNTDDQKKQGQTHPRPRGDPHNSRPYNENSRGRPVQLVIGRSCLQWILWIAIFPIHLLLLLFSSFSSRFVVSLSTPKFLDPSSASSSSSSFWSTSNLLLSFLLSKTPALTFIRNQLGLRLYRPDSRCLFFFFFFFVAATTGSPTRFRSRIYPVACRTFLPRYPRRANSTDDIAATRSRSAIIASRADRCRERSPDEHSRVHAPPLPALAFSVLFVPSPHSRVPIQRIFGKSTPVIDLQEELRRICNK